MPVLDPQTKASRLVQVLQEWFRDADLGLQNLLLHGMRSFLTMLGMIFGVAAVVSMLSIGAGARQKVMAFIEQMGVRNLIVEAKETTEWQAHAKIRKITPGLTLEDYRVIQSDVPGIEASTPRKRMTPSRIIPASQQDVPAVYGVNAAYQQIGGLRVLQGRFFTDAEDRDGAPVCVLGAAARFNLFGSADPVGQWVKVNEQWLRVIGIVSPQLGAPSDATGVLPSTDVNNVIYTPLGAAILRLEDSYSDVRDEIDGIYVKLRNGQDLEQSAQIVRAILQSSHHGANDYSVIVPAELLAEQRKTEQLFNTVMVAIASVSLLVGGIGIMNIMLVSVTERTREIGLRMAIGATEGNVQQQFLIEAVVLSLMGGTVGILFGLTASYVITQTLGWPVLVSPVVIVIAVLFSMAVGVFFGFYPARKAAQLDPIEALRYE